MWNSKHFYLLILHDGALGMHRLYLLLMVAGLACISAPTHAQWADSLQLRLGTTATLATQDYLPLWLVSNRFGTISDQQADLSSFLSLSNKHVYKGQSPLYAYLREYENLPEIGLEYGLDVYNNDHFQQVFVQQAYVKVNYNHWQLRAGRYEEVWGEANPQLSSGSLGISGNALPIPKISLAVTDYTPVPFTQGWLQFKGVFSHGWMGRERFVKGAWLHERNLYLSVGKKAFQLYGGYNRFAVWGGEHPEEGALPHSLRDFGLVVLGPPADANAPWTYEAFDRLGNHLGFIEYGFDLELESFRLEAYTQVPFENQSGVQPFRNPDRLTGVNFIPKSTSLLSAVTLEWIHTLYQSGTDPNTGFDNYYNNMLYRSGWSYLGRTIGTPLFTDQQRAVAYAGEAFIGAKPWPIVNNRIRGFHVGVTGKVFPGFSYRTLFTYTTNHGNYFNNEQFTPHKQQWYFMQELVYQKNAWKFTGAIGVDRGALTHNIGTLLSIERKIL